MRFSYKYLIAFVILFIIEVLIAVYVHDNFVRPYVGDVLVVILVYFFVRIFTDKWKKLLPLYVFLFAVIIEILQFLKIGEILNLQQNSIASVVVGTSFDTNDIICYLVGTVIIWLLKI